MLLPGPILIVDAAAAALLAELLQPSLRRASYEHRKFSPDQRQLFIDLGQLARAHTEHARIKATDHVGPLGPSRNGPAPKLDVVNTTKAADRLGVSEHQVCKLIAAGHLPARKLRGRWVINLHDLNDEHERRQQQWSTQT